MRSLFAAVLFAACSFDSSGVGGSPDASSPPDGTSDAPSDRPSDRSGFDGPMFDVPHVPTAGAFGGVADLMLSSSTIDTGTLTVAGGLPPDGIAFDVWPQNPSGPELAVLHVRNFTVNAGAQVRIVGPRPLVIIAAGPVQIDGVIDAGAHLAMPGPGGAMPGMGIGAGTGGTHAGMFSDSGGGGGGFAMPGGTGGDATGETPAAPGGRGGAMYDDPMLMALEGGSGGGAGSAGPTGCAALNGGAGGGAIQIYTPMMLTVGAQGGISVGGGGGAGGPMCSSSTGAGSGGGSGGALFLQAFGVVNNGVLASNGGGGGGGGSTTFVGSPGQDGPMNGIGAYGGPSVGMFGRAGGSGAVGTNAPSDGGTDNSSGGGNAGGGGGSIGRFRVLTHTTFDNFGTLSPVPSIGMF